MSDDGDAYECPCCGEIVQAVRGPVPRLLQCPACEEQFVIPSQDGSTEFCEAPQPVRQETDELDSLRIRHLIVSRRTAIRSRSYNILAAAACLIAAGKMIQMAWVEVRFLGWHFRQASFVLFAIAGLIGVPFFLGRAAHWSRQSKGATIPDPETPPDFSALSDGSQYSRNLEELK